MERSSPEPVALSVKKLLQGLAQIMIYVFLGAALGFWWGIAIVLGIYLLMLAIIGIAELDKGLKK